MNKSSPELPSLQDVLQLINEAVDDFNSKPARTASDKGAFEDYPIHKVAIWGDVPCATVLLDNGADVNAAGEDDDTPLHRAIGARHAEMVRLLISRGADPDRRNRYGNTPRGDARDSGDQEIMKVIDGSNGPVT